MLSKALSESINHNKFPTDIRFSEAVEPSNSKEGSFHVSYTFDPEVQNEAIKLLEHYKPDYAAIFIMNAQTGRVLAMTSYEKDNPEETNWVLKSNFPAASTFKVVTATVAVDRAGLLPMHQIHYNGGAYTLYRKNVMSNKITRWTNVISLKDAFARSINSAFGRLSLEKLRPEDLNDYASRFMFNQEIPADFPVESGVAYVPPEKGFELTEVASGYNRTNRMSAVQGAMIAASISNDGKMVVPYIVDNLKDSSGELVYRAESLEKGQVMSPESASKIRELMEETVQSGTSRRSFRPLVKNKRYDNIEMGGKTGHMTGENPKGKVDWFVGYAMDDDQKIAVAAVTVNKKYWTVKSSYLGQSLIGKYFSRFLPAPAAAPRKISSRR